MAHAQKEVQQETVAQLSIRAAKLRRSCGRYAALRFALHNNIPSRLYRLACQLTAIERVAPTAVY